MGLGRSQVELRRDAAGDTTPCGCSSILAWTLAPAAAMQGRFGSLTRRSFRLNLLHLVADAPLQSKQCSTRTWQLIHLRCTSLTTPCSGRTLDKSRVNATAFAWQFVQ